MIGSILGIVARTIFMIDQTMATMVTGQEYVFTRGPDNQWAIAQRTFPELTEKGYAVVSDIATIIHYGLDTLAQIVAALPGPSI
jgi:hypothetical protein